MISECVMCDDDVKNLFLRFQSRHNELLFLSLPFIMAFSAGSATMVTHYNTSNPRLPYSSARSATMVSSVIFLLTTTLATSFRLPNPIQIVSRDYQALTRRVTAHHILLPKSTDAALALKQKIRNAVSPKKDSDVDPMYIVDAFSAAAAKYSRDDETAVRGGLLGEMVPQGYCRANEIDKACFEVALGDVVGKIFMI